MFTWICPVCNEYHSKQIEKSLQTIGWYVRGVCRCFRCERSGGYYFVIYNPAKCLLCNRYACIEPKVMVEEIEYDAT